MSTFTIDELDREEIEFLPARVVMTTCNPRPCPPPPCAPAPCPPTYCAPVEHCAPLVEIGIKIRIGGLFGGNV